jgi:hypothetical protein
MVKRQSRRSLSVRGVTYNQLREYCSRINLSMSDFLEQRIADYFTANHVTFAMPGTQPKPQGRPVPKPAPRPLAAFKPIAPVTLSTVKDAPSPPRRGVASAPVAIATPTKVAKPVAIPAPIPHQAGRDPVANARTAASAASQSPPPARTPATGPPVVAGLAAKSTERAARDFEARAKGTARAVDAAMVGSAMRADAPPSVHRPAEPERLASARDPRVAGASPPPRPSIAAASPVASAPKPPTAVVSAPEARPTPTPTKATPAKPASVGRPPATPAAVAVPKTLQIARAAYTESLQF